MYRRNITRLAIAIVILSFVLSTFVSLWSLRLMAKRNMQFSRALRTAHPELYEKLKERRRLAAEHIAGKYPEYAADIAELYKTTEDTSENE